jgi:hypothetical protein
MELNERLQMIADGTRRVFGDEYHCEIFLYDPVHQLLDLKASTSVEEDLWKNYISSK